MVSKSSIIEKNIHVVSRILENPSLADSSQSVNYDELIVINPNMGQIKVFNEVGAKIWSLIDGNKSVDEIVMTLVAEYEVEYNVVVQDTLVFLEELLQSSLVSDVSNEAG